MPEKSGEIVVVLTKSFTGGESWIGQTLRQDPDGEAVDGLPEEFTVVGTVKSAMYLSMENESTTAGSGSLGLLAYTVPESFTLDYYTGFYLAVADTVELTPSPRLTTTWWRLSPTPWSPWGRSAPKSAMSS